MANWQPGQPLKVLTRNYVLRTLTPADATDDYIGWWNDPEIQEGFNQPARGWDRARAQQHISGFDNQKAFHFGIFQKSTGTMIGFFALFVDYNTKVAKTNICIGDKSLWGKDIGLEVRRAVLNFAFGPLGMEKAEGEVQGRNLPSFYNYKVMGFTLEGVLREHIVKPGGGRASVYLFGLQKDEWVKAEQEGKHNSFVKGGPVGA